MRKLFSLKKDKRKFCTSKIIIKTENMFSMGNITHENPKFVVNHKSNPL